MEKKVYTSPEIEVLDVVVESGFALSGEPKFDGFRDEEEWG